MELTPEVSARWGTLDGFDLPDINGRGKDDATRWACVPVDAVLASMGCGARILAPAACCCSAVTSVVVVFVLL